MTCKQWNDEWVAKLYGELEADEERRVDQHLADCDACRETLEQLSVSRQWLQDAAPLVPATPRVVVLEPPRFRYPVWAFAAGAACALLLFAAGLFAGRGIFATPATPPLGANDDQLNKPVLQAEFLMALQETRDEFERKLALVSRSQPQAQPDTLRAALNRQQLQDELDHLQRSFEVSRAEDFNFLLQEITAAELRTGSRINDTRQVLRYYVLSADPRLSEQ